MSEWIFLVPSVVYSRIIDEFDADLKTKYNMTADNFSTTDSANKNAIFPFAFINQLQGTEEGQTLDGETVNGGLFSFQIDVYDNKTQQRARTVMAEICKIMKSMHFEIVGMPIVESGDTHRCTMRFRRMIGASDSL